MKLNLQVLGAHEIGRPKYRAGNPIIEGKLYQFRQPIYDVYMVTVGTALDNQLLFTIPRGQNYTPTGGAAFAKRFWHTNMSQPQLLPAPNKMYCKAISISVHPQTDVVDIQRFLFDTLVTFFIDDRDFLRNHIWKLPSGGGAWAGGSSALVQNGEPRRDNQFAFTGELGETIEQQQSFSVEMNPTLVTLANAAGVYTTAAAPAIGINAFVHLDGLLNRSIL